MKNTNTICIPFYLSVKLAVPNQRDAMLLACGIMYYKGVLCELQTLLGKCSKILSQ